MAPGSVAAWVRFDGLVSVQRASVDAGAAKLRSRVVCAIHAFHSRLATPILTSIVVHQHAAVIFMLRNWNVERCLPSKTLPSFRNRRSDIRNP